MGYIGTVAFSSSQGTTLPSFYTFNLGDAGSHTFSNQISFNSPGEYTVTAIDMNYPSFTATPKCDYGFYLVAGNVANSSATVPAGNVGEITSISILINDALGDPIQAGEDLVISIGGSNTGIFCRRFPIWAPAAIPPLISQQLQVVIPFR